MVRLDLERRRHLTLLGPMAHEARVAAAAERKRERVEQDRFARAGLAGQHRQAGGGIDVEPFDQNDVADREAGEHGILAVIPGRRAAASPESITTKRAVFKQLRNIESVVFMDSGLAPPARPGMTGELPQPDLLERAADPGPLILVGLEPAAAPQSVGVLVPLAVREIVPEH